MKAILLLTGVVVFAFSCVQVQNQKKSRVGYFHYGGYGDTICATLYGQVWYADATIQTQDSLVKLNGVQIKVLENDSTYITGADGNFQFCCKNGTYRLLVTKNGFQPLLIKNYVSRSDRLSEIKIYLEKGNARQTFTIPAESNE
jgi:hypothetical protein